MSQIHITDGQTDRILDVITAQYIIEDVHKQSLEDTLETYDFTTFADKRFSQYLEKRNRLIIPDEDGEYREFIIEESIKDMTRRTEVYSTASYLELKKQAVIYPQTFNEQTATQMVSHATNGTEWVPGIIEISNYRTFNVENHTNPYNFLKTIANEFDVELRFRVETDGKRVTRRYVDLLERRGIWRGREVTFGKDLAGIKRTETTDNVYTALVGIGPEREDGTQLEVLVEDEDALQRWGRRDPVTGELMHLIGTYEPQSTREEMTEDELRQYTRTELNKRINEVVKYEADIVDLEHVPGMENKKIRFGDTIKIKDTNFNPPLYLEARVFEQERSIVDKSRKKIKLGDYTEFTEEEVTAIWQQLQNQIQDKLDAAEMREYTYDKLTIDDKDETVFEEGKTFAELQGQTAEDNAKSHADTVASQAEQNAKDHADDAAGQALIDAQNYAVAQEVYDNKMTEIANDLADKSSIEYVDGQLVDKANKNDVYTIDETDNMLLNYVGVTEYQTDMDGVVQDLDSHSTTLGQHEEAIALKADASRVDTLEGTVSDHSAELSVMNDEIASKVEADYVQGEIDKLEVGGRNLILNSDFSNGEDNWTLSGGAELTDEGALLDSAEGSSEYVQPQTEIPSGNYTVQIWYKHLEGHTPYLFSTNGTDMSASNTRGLFEKTLDDEEPKWKIAKIDIQVNSESRFYAIRYASGAPSDHLEGKTLIQKIKIEKGNKATDWTPAPEDTQSQIDDLDVTVSNHSTEIQQNATAITQKAESSELDTLTGRVSTAESEIQQQADEIALKVDEDGVIAAINLSPETARIEAENIELVGAVTVLSDITDDLGTIEAGDIYGVYIEGAEIVQSGAEGSIELNDEGLHTYDEDGTERITIRTTADEFESYAPSIITFEPETSDYTFMVATNAHGLGDAFIGFPDHNGTPDINRWFSIRNWNGRIDLDASDIEMRADDYIEVPEGIRVKAQGSSSGIAIGNEDYTSSDYDHVIVSHTTRKDFMIYPQRWAGENRFTIRSHNGKSDYADEFLIDSDSVFRSRGIYYNTSSNSQNARVSYSGDKTNGTVYRVTSARKYKTDIKSVDIDPYKLLNAELRTWYDKKELEENGGSTDGIERNYGLIADEIEEIGLPEYVDYMDGEIEGLAYDRLWTLLIPIVRDLTKKVDELEAKLNETGC